MTTHLSTPFSTRLLGWLGRNPLKELIGAAAWLIVGFFIFWLLRLIPGASGTLFGGLQLLFGVALLTIAIPLLVRFVRRRMLWSLRNKLIITYLLVGLAPVVLFATLVMVSAYIAAGQFAIHLANTRIQTELEQISSDTTGLTVRIAHQINTQADGKPQRPQDFTATEQAAAAEVRGVRLRRHLEAFVNGVPLLLPGSSVMSSAPLGLPPWAVNLKGGKFRSLVLDGNDLYLVAIQQERLLDGRKLTLISEMPVDSAFMELVAHGLGGARIFAHSADGDRQTEDEGTPHSPSVSGGSELPARNLADIRVRFLSTTSATDWETGRPNNVPIVVDSRPGLLYLQLFGDSLGSNISSVIRTSLILLCIVFAFIEILALFMAIRLSRTMTASVADLYAATLSIDSGNLHHRIAVSRTDQLAELSHSFNRMAVSLQRLLEEQHEKELLQNELFIAQEVQANLFPTAMRNLPGLELHGICRPARSVSGDYYDFLVFYKDDNDAAQGGEVGGPASHIETGVGIALGDISGKGISAALLMATLHSAVRAYSFANEHMIYATSAVAGLTIRRDGRIGDPGELFESPGRIMSLLNRHLYRSTQQEKYATLFLAYYDAATAWLTYTNAGHLPPLLLSHDGTIRRLDQGGTVVGLMDGMRYDEGRFQMQVGDILIAYSDGVTEPENEFGEFGEERLVEVVTRYRDQPLDVISAQVMRALDAWNGAGEQPDDITLVLARQV